LQGVFGRRSRQASRVVEGAIPRFRVIVGLCRPSGASGKDKARDDGGPAHSMPQFGLLAGSHRSSGEQRHQLPRIRQRFQCPNCRQRGIHTCIRQRLPRITRAVAELGLELGIGERLLQ